MTADAPDPPNPPTGSLPDAPVPADVIERLRRTGIRLDREGRFWHEGAEVTHPGLRRALFRWLDRLDDGRPILRLDQRRYAYVEVDDAHLLALSARWRGDRAFLALNDGSEEELAYDTLRVGRGNALYASVRGGRLEARITTPAYHTLAQRIEPAEKTASDRFVLRAAGRVFAIEDRGDFGR